MDKPWIDGPKELMMHAAEHLNSKSDFDRRIAFISIDNAVELSIKTFLSLPKRIRKVDGPKRQEVTDAENSFPASIDLLEKYFANKVSDISLEDIEWYHRIRNQLYHAGNGVTVDLSKVEAYFEIAKGLFNCLYDEELLNNFQFAYTTNIGKFMQAWTEFNKNLRAKLPPRNGEYAYYWKRNYLSNIDPTLVSIYNEVVEFKDHIARGELDSTTNDYKRFIEKIEHLRVRIH